MGKAFKHCSQQLGLFFILAWFYAIIRVFHRGKQWQIAFLYELSLKWDTLSTFCNVVLWYEICILKNFVILVFSYWANTVKLSWKILSKSNHYQQPYISRIFFNILAVSNKTCLLSLSFFCCDTSLFQYLSLLLSYYLYHQHYFLPCNYHF